MILLCYDGFAMPINLIRKWAVPINFDLRYVQEIDSNKGEEVMQTI